MGVRMRVQGLSDDELDRLLRVAKENCITTLPNAALGRRFGLSRPQISKILKKYQVARPTCR
jgi:hypothetical protein